MNVQEVTKVVARESASVREWSYASRRKSPTVAVPPSGRHPANCRSFWVVAVLSRVKSTISTYSTGMGPLGIAILKLSSLRSGTEMGALR